MTKDPLIHPDAEAEPAIEPGSSTLRKILRFIGYPAAFVLLGLSIWLAVKGGQSNEGESGFKHLFQASASQISMMLGCVVFSIVINGYVFYALLKPFPNGRPVSFFSMVKLIAATSLLNYMPMRAGMVGRAAYLKEYHQVGYRLSLLMLFIAAGFTVLTFLIMLLLNAWRTQLDAVWFISLTIILLCIARFMPAVMCQIIKRFPGFKDIALDWFSNLSFAKTSHIFVWLWARAFDVLAYALRLYIVVQVLGKETSFVVILTYAISGMFTTLATPLPNGLGLKELVFGLLASAGLGGETMASLESGIMLGLVDRAVEAIVFIVTGLLSIAILHFKKPDPVIQSPD